MRLHTLTLRDVKGITQRTVTFPDHGVVVIEGPNEIGKSTLLEAFDRLLDPRAKATSRSSRVRDLKPVDRDVGPYVCAEFTVGGHRLRFAKQWLRDPSTTLEVLAPVHEQLSGSAAQERLDAILAESLDQQLWEALRFTQAGQLGQVALSDSGVLTEALDAASGAALHAAEGADLLDRVEAEYLRYFTPTGRPARELKAAVTAAHEARDFAVQAFQRLQETEDLVREDERLRAEAERMAEVTPALEDALALATTHADRVAEIEAAHQRARESLRAATERSERAREDQRTRTLAVRQTAAAAESLATTEERLAGLEARAAELTEALAPLASAVEEGEQALERATEVCRRAAADADHLADVAEAESLAARAAQLASLHGDLEDARAELAAATVTPRLLSAVEEAHREVELLRARHQVASGALDIEALADGVALRIGEEAVVLHDGERARRRVLDGLEIELPGAVRITLTPEKSALARAEEIARAQERCTALLRSAGVTDLETARRAVTERAEAQARLDRLQDRVADLSAGLDEAALVSRLEELQRAIDAVLDSRPGDCPLPADAGQARAVARAAEEERERARGAAKATAAAHRRAKDSLDRLTLELTREQARAEGDRARLARDQDQLEQSRRQVSDEALAEQVTRLAGEFARVEAVAVEARRELAQADVEGVRSRLEAARHRLEVHRRDTQRVREQALQLRAKVQMASSEGRAETYDLAVAVFEETRSTLRAVDRRARAARQLRQTLGRHRDTAHRAYVRPYAREIERLGQLVYGPTFQVEVAEDLTIEARKLDGTLVPFEQLSGGAREQLGILARLAVAGLVEADQGVPVIIDDALGYTDPERLHRVGAVFAGPAQRTQVILLTCTPERYAGIPHATTIQLTA